MQPKRSCYNDTMTRTLTARFDGKVIVPDDRPELPINQRLRLTVEPLENGTPPNGTPGFNRIDAAKHRVSEYKLRSKAVFDRVDLDLRVDLPHRARRGIDLGPADILVLVALRRNVDRRHVGEVHQSQLRHAPGRELQGNVPADRTDTDDRNLQSRQPAARHEGLLPSESIRSSIH